MLKKIIFYLCFMLGAFSPTFSFAYDLTAIQNLVGVREIKVISMDFKNAQLADVLKIFSQQSGLNFIASSDIADKKINLYLDKVPVEEALERILSANSFTYELKEDSNIFVVKKVTKPNQELMTRVYPLRFASVSSSKLISALESDSASEGGGEGAASAGEASPAAAEGAAGGSSSGSTGLISAIQSILSQNGSVVEDSRTNSLIVTDIPTQFPNIEQVLARLDVRIPQILIEVEMLDISKNTADLLGAKWSDNLGELTGANKVVLFPFNPNNGFQTRDKAKPEGADDGVTTLYKPGGNMDFSSLKITLQFLKTQTDTKSLARPHILTLNNETAEIKIETDEAIQIDSKTDAETNETTTTVIRSNTGVSLRVTPQANLLTNEITLAVEPSVIEAKPSNLVSDAQIKDPEQRGSKSLLRVKNGDTVVIGGLLRSDVDDTRTSVPGISKIPLLGAAFRHKNKNEQQRELLIFITPHIVDEDEDSSTMTSTVSVLDREQSLSEK